MPLALRHLALSLASLPVPAGVDPRALAEPGWTMLLAGIGLMGAALRRRRPARRVAPRPA